MTMATTEQKIVSAPAHWKLGRWFAKRATQSRLSILPALALSACFLAAAPIAAQAQVNPEIANCSELKDEGTIFQADLCSAHVGCRLVLNVQKTCARARGYLERLQVAIGEGTRTLFGYRKEITPDAIFSAVLNGDDYEHARKFGGLEAPQRMVQEVGTRVRDVGSGDTITVNGSKGTYMMYYGQVKDGKADGSGSRIFASGEVQRGQFRDGKRNGTVDILFPSGARFVGNYVDDAFSGQGTYVVKDGGTITGAWRSLINQGTYLRTDGTRFEGTTNLNKRIQGREYRADGTLSEEGRYENDELSVGTRYDAAGTRTVIDSAAERAAAARAVAEAEQQRKRDEAARAEQQFRASLQTMNPGQLFARADELNVQGDRSRAREVQRTLMSRFPDHPLAATAARQMAGESGSNPSAGGSSMPAGAAIAASRPAGGRLSSQACEAMKQSIIATKVPPNASVTSAMETVMFMTKTELDMIDGGCPTEPGVTPAQVAAARKERQQQYATAEQNCNAVQSGGRRCVPQAHTAAAAVSKPPVASAAQNAQQNATISYDPVTGRCIGAREACACQPGIGANKEYGECPSSRSSSGGGIRTAR